MHGRLGPGHRGGAGDKVGEIDFDVSGLGIQAPLQLVQDCPNRLDGDLPLMCAQYLNEAAHVRAFEMPGQADRHRDCGDSRLRLLLSIQDDDWKGKIADADLVDREAAVIRGHLDIWKRSRRSVFHAIKLWHC